MIIALKHDNSTLIGVYENLQDFADSNFELLLNENREIEVRSRHFDMYVNKKIISAITYGKDYTDIEAVYHYVSDQFIHDIKRYGISVFKQMQKL